MLGTDSVDCVYSLCADTCRLFCGGNESLNSMMKPQGHNNEGQLGLGNTGNKNTPQDVDLGASFDPIKVFAGYRKSCAVSSAGESKC